MQSWLPVSATTAGTAIYFDRPEARWYRHIQVHLAGVALLPWRPVARRGRMATPQAGYRLFALFHECPQGTRALVACSMATSNEIRGLRGLE